jgi:hypothetical protein
MSARLPNRALADMNEQEGIASCRGFCAATASPVTVVVVIGEWAG